MASLYTTDLKTNQLFSVSMWVIYITGKPWEQKLIIEHKVLISL